MKKINRFYIILILVSIVVVSITYFVFNAIQSEEIINRLFEDSVNNTVKNTYFLLKKYYESNNIMLRIVDDDYLEIIKRFDERLKENDITNFSFVEDIIKEYSIKDVKIFNTKNELLFVKSIDENACITDDKYYDDKINLMVDYMIKNNEESFIVKIESRKSNYPHNDMVFHKINNHIIAFAIREKNSIKVMNTNFDLSGFELPEEVEYIMLKDNSNDEIYFTSNTAVNSLDKNSVISPDKKIHLKSNKNKKFPTESHMVTINKKVYYEKTTPFRFPSLRNCTLIIGINTNSLFYIKNINGLTIIISSIIYVFLLIGVIFFLIRLDNTAVISKASQEKYDSLVIMTKQIAHELRNPLNTLSMAVKDIEYEIEDGEVSGDSLELVYDRVYAIDKIIKDFNIVTDNLHLEKSEVNLKQFFDKIIKRFKKEYPEVSFLKNVVDKNVVLDPDKMEQAISNIFKNSIDAMDKQTIKMIEIQALINKNIEITITDSGNGIQQDIIDKLFVPFTTTKATGSGLGLTIVKKIIEAHSGTISIKNTKEYGALVRIILPEK